MERQYDLMWRTLGVCDIICGTNVLHDSSKKFTKLQIFCRIGSLFLYITFMSVLIFNSYKFRNNLLLFILASSMFVSFCTAGMDVHSLVKRRENFIKVLNWCRKVIERDGKIFFMARKACIRIVIISFGTVYYLGFSATVQPTVMGLIHAPEIHAAPMPFVLPWLEPTTWIAFVCNTTLQTLSCLVWDTLAGIVYSIMGIHYYATFAFIDDLKEKITVLGSEIEEENKKTTQKSCKIWKKNRKLGKSIIIRHRSISNNDKDFAGRLKHFVEAYSEAVDIFNTLADPLKYVMLWMEYLCFATIFIGGIIILIEKEHWSLSISFLGTAATFFPCCYVNEHVKDKLLEISFALYNLPWYYLAPKDRRKLLLALNCGFFTGGFTAANMHEVSLERFAAIVQSAYKNCLVLKDLIVAFN